MTVQDERYKYCHHCQSMQLLHPAGLSPLFVFYKCECGGTIEIPRARPAKVREGEERRAQH